MISSLSPSDVQIPIHSELRESEKLFYDQINLKYISAHVDETNAPENDKVICTSYADDGSLLSS